MNKVIAQLMSAKSTSTVSSDVPVGTFPFEIPFSTSVV
jgi:hypothetical protein